MFGKKTKKEKAVTQVETETPDLEVIKEAVEAPAVEEVKEEVKEEPTPTKTETPEEEVARLEAEIVRLKAPEVKKTVKIIGVEMIGDGMFKFVLVSNYSLGEIGEVIEE